MLDFRFSNRVETGKGKHKKSIQDFQVKKIKCVHDEWKMPQGIYFGLIMKHKSDQTENLLHISFLQVFLIMMQRFNMLSELEVKIWFFTRSFLIGVPLSMLKKGGKFGLELAFVQWNGRTPLDLSNE